MLFSMLISQTVTWVCHYVIGDFYELYMDLSSMLYLFNFILNCVCLCGEKKGLLPSIYY